MTSGRLGFSGFKLVAPPIGGFWRVSSWHDPFEPPPPAPPLGAPPQDDDGHRFDDPDGIFRTLYCATEAEGALGECLGDFVYSEAAAVAVDSFLESEPDDEFREDLFHPLTEDDVEGFGWTLAHAPATAGQLIDTTHWSTSLATAPYAVRILRQLRPDLDPRRLRRLFDRHLLLAPWRPFTRSLAGIWHKESQDAFGNLRARGLRFTSRLPPAWECWALWEPLCIDETAVTTEPVTIDTAALRSAAGKLGVFLAG